MAKRTVLFLGAGASKPLGYPLTSGILPAIWTALRTGDWEKWAGMRQGDVLYAENRERLESLIRTLFPGISAEPKAWDGGSIVDVISLVDQMILEGRTPHPDMNEDRFREARVLLTMGINGVLQGRSGPSLRSGLASWILGEAAREDVEKFTVVSTNYDTTIELPIFELLEECGASVGSTVDMGFAWRDAGADRVHLRPRRARLGVFKLHGSLNWLRCETCGHVTINTSGRIASLGFRREKSEYNSCWCGGLLRNILVIPSIVRDVRDTNLLSTWNAALEELRHADEWVFVGYSLPSEDVAIRSMLLRAFHSRSTPDLPRIRLVQKWPKDDSQGLAQRSRYELFFPSTHMRPDDIHETGLETFVNELPRLPEDELQRCLRTRFATGERA